MFSCNKNFGQNFISDKNLINNIIDKCDIDKETLVIEVGPGLGALTEFIVPQSKHTLIYEIDGRLEEIIKNKLKKYDNYTLYIKDFLKANILDDLSNISYKKIVFVSNLPYYITSNILEKLLDSNILFDKIVIMTQKEFADRLLLNNNALSVIFNTNYDIRKEFNISKSYFNPVPKVDSSLLVFKLNSRLDLIKDFKLYKKIVSLSFLQRRKSLKNNLKSLNIENLEEILNNLNLNTNIRAEQLKIDDFIYILNNLKIN